MEHYHRELLNSQLTLGYSIYVGSTTAFNAFVGSFVLSEESHPCLSFHFLTRSSVLGILYVSDIAELVDWTEEHQLWNIRELQLPGGRIVLTRSRN